MLVCCAGAPFLIMLDTNIVAVSLPSIARDLHGAFTDVEWVVSAYILPFTALLMPAGALADRWGRRRMLVAGLTLFTVASLLCGLAPSLAVLNAARVLQAVGAALQLSSALAAIANGFHAHERARVFAIFGTVMGVAPSLGPLLGGLVTSALGWRWAFLINLPFGAILLALALTSVDESRDPQARQLDVPGIVLFGCGLSAVVWALIGVNAAGWGSADTLWKFGIGGALLAAFVLAERLHPRPMFELTLFRDRVFVGAAIATIGYAGCAQVMMTLLPLYLQDAFGFSPAVAGVAMIPFALPLLVMPGIGGRLAAYRPSRWVLSRSLALTALGNGLAAAAVMAGCGYWVVAVGMVVTGASAGLLNAETTKAQIAAVPPGRAGMASGIATTTRFVGINFGLAGLGTVLAGVAEGSLRGRGDALAPGQGIDWQALSLRVVGGDLVGGLSSLPPGLRAALAPAVQGSMAAGFGAVLASAAIVALAAGLLSSWLMRR